MFKRIGSYLIAAFIAASILTGQGVTQSPQAQAQAQVPTYASIVGTGTASASASSDYVTKPKKVTTVGCAAGTRIGAICKDGWHSSATGRGACSWHKGVKVWLLCNKK